MFLGKSKVFIVLLLCVALLLPLAACSKNEEKSDDNNNSNTATESSDVESAEPADPDAPNLPKIDMGGKTFTILTSGWGGDSNLSNDLAVEEYTGEPIDDASYERKIKIEQEYNCKIVQFNESDSNEVVTKYVNSILAADNAYAFAVTTCTNFSSLLLGNYLIDLKELPYVDMDKPYWDKDFNNSMAIMGKNFAASGDISKRRLECVWIMCFNKAMITDYNLESPYDLVKEGKWTYDKMHEMGKMVAHDINGDGVMNRVDDIWGINYTGDTIMGIINSSGVKIAELDANGIPQLTIDTEANLGKLMRIYTEMRDNTYSIDTLFQSGGGVTGLPDAQIFSEGRCLFLACATHNVSQIREGDSADIGLRTMQTDFGIIPYPKWDESQANYMPHTAGNYHPVISVPITNDDLENTSIIMEALAYEGRKTIIPIFYDSLLKTKTARDEESVEMLDYIFGNMSYDVGNMYNIGGIVGVFGYEMSTNLRANIVSTVEKNKVKWQKAIDDMITEIEKTQ